MGHLGERHHRPSFTGARIAFPEGRMDRGEEATARRVFHQDEFSQSQLLRDAILPVRAVKLPKFSRYKSFEFFVSSNPREYLRTEPAYGTVTSEARQLRGNKREFLIPPPSPSVSQLR